MSHAHFLRVSLTALMLAVIGGGVQATLADEALQQEAVRQALVGLAQAYNKHDAAAFAAIWTDDAIYADPVGGVQLDGRVQIQAWYAQLFKDQPQAALKAEVNAIELDGDSQAFVRGMSEVTDGSGEPVLDLGAFEQRHTVPVTRALPRRGRRFPLPSRPFGPSMSGKPVAQHGCEPGTGCHGRLGLAQGLSAGFLHRILREVRIARQRARELAQPSQVREQGCGDVGSHGGRQGNRSSLRKGDRGRRIRCRILSVQADIPVRANFA